MLSYGTSAGFAIFKWRIFFALNGEERAAEYLKDQLTVLGPAFVKIGQAVSSRPDVVPPVYIKQLEYLQVRLPSGVFCTVHSDTHPLHAAHGNVQQKVKGERLHMCSPVKARIGSCWMCCNKP
jgi:hypothetical protein